MKIKSLLIILLLSLFTIALEAELVGYGDEEIALVQEQVSESLDTFDDTDDDDRLFFHFDKLLAFSHPRVMKIDFHSRLKERDFSLEIHKPPIV